MKFFISLQATYVYLFVCVLTSFSTVLPREPKHGFPVLQEEAEYVVSSSSAAFSYFTYVDVKAQTMDWPACSTACAINLL